MGVTEKFLEVDKANRVFGLDLLRSVAILLVLLAHGDFILAKNFSSYTSIWMLDGVDVFFVLSGFLIGGILLKELKKNSGKINVISFWKRRWYRTLPNYLLVLMTLIVINILLLKNAAVAPLIWKYLLFVQNFLYPMTGFFPESWSLSIEEWFYLFLPILCIAFLGLIKNYGHAFLLTALSLVAVSLSYKIYKSGQFAAGPQVYDEYFRKVVLARLDSLAIGVLGAYWLFFHRQGFYSYRYIKLFCGLGLIAITLLLPYTQFKLVFNSFIFSTGMLFCFPLCASLRSYPKYFGDFILYVSVISYSLYLFHFSIVLWFLVGVEVYSSPASVFTHYLMYFLLSFIISTVNYKYFELYFLKKR